MNKLLSYCFDKWWILPLFSVVIFALFFLFDNIWLLLISLLLIIVSVIFQFIKKRWKLVCLSGSSLFVYLCLLPFWFVSQLVFPNLDPDSIHRAYSKRYENREEIQNIIGVKIPKFKVIDSRLVHIRQFDFEFEVQSTIEFKTTPDDNFFFMLDSICELPVPEEPNKNSSFFYYSLEGVEGCWSKNGNEYKYVRDWDNGGEFLHSLDAYFNFTIIKDSNTANIRYGNY